MVRNEYLRDRYVRSFIDYLAGVISGDTALPISIAFPRNKLPTNFESKFNGEIERRDRDFVFVVTVDSLQQLFQRYWCGYKPYEGNRAQVDLVRTFVRSAIASEASSRALDLTLLACQKVMEWGFGRGSRTAESNMAWAISLGSSLVQVLREGREALSCDAPDFSAFGKTPGEGTHWARMNAGWTKYYSFALERHLIYDSRVGAALGYLVRTYLEGLHPVTRPNSVPPSLAFRWAQGQGDINLRDPTCGQFKFYRLTGGPSGSREWARVNIRANWILAEAIEQSGANWCAGPDGFRRLEGALFMLGYDLSRAQHASRSPASIVHRIDASLFD